MPRNGTAVLSSSPRGCPETCADPKTVRAVQRQMLSDDEVANLKQMFEMLDDHTRIRILFSLSRAGSLCVGDIAHLLGMTFSAVSHQLRKLRDRQLVKARSEGNQVFYSLGDDPCIRRLLEYSLCLARETAVAK